MVTNISSIEDRESVLRQIGSTWVYDSIFLFVFPPIGLASLLSNLISYYILSGPYFAHKPLYTYLKAMCLNSAVTNLVSISNILWNTKHYLDISNTQWTSMLRCYFKMPVAFGTYFYGSVIDIVLALERLFELTNQRHVFRRFQPSRVCLVLLIACIVFNIPFFFVFVPTRKELFNPVKNTTEYIYFYGESEFALSRTGKVIKTVHYLFRDAFTLAILILINMISLILFRRIYYKQGVYSLLKQHRNSTMMVNITTTRMNDTSSESSGQNKKCVSFLLSQQNMRTRWYFSVARANNMLTKMVFIICALSACEHTFVLIILNFFTDSPFSLKSFDLQLFVFLANLSTLIKNSVNIFIFYNFNEFFKSKFLALISGFLRFKLLFRCKCKL